MDPQVPASFIPKKPLDSGGRRSAGFGLFLLLSLLVFVASLVAAGAALLYQEYLNNQLASEMQSLKLSESAYDPSTIQDLIRTDSRINNAETLLASHVAVSALFNFLSTQTLQNVSWNGFDYELQDDGSATLSLSGVANSFSTVALQSDQFGASQYLKNVVFSNISVGTQGTITFGVSADVVPSLLLYSNTLGQPVPALGGATTTSS